MSRKKPLAQANKTEALTAAELAQRLVKQPEQGELLNGKQLQAVIEDEDEKSQALAEAANEGETLAAMESGDAGMSGGDPVHLAEVAGAPASDAPPAAAGSAPASTAGGGAVAAGGTALGELGSGLLIAGGVIAVAAAAGGGGGGGTTTAPATVVSGTLVGGPVVAGNGLTIQLYQADGTTTIKDAGNNPITATLGADGSFTVDIGSYTGVVIAKAVDASAGADYIDEATGLAVDLSANLMAMGIASGGTLTLNVNPLTTVAVLTAGANPSASAVTDTNTAVAQAFGLTDLTGTSVVTTVDANGGANAAYDPTTLSNAEQYGAVLAALSGMDQAGGAQATIDSLAANITVTGSTGALSATALNALMNGAATADGNTTGNLLSLISNVTAKSTASVGINAVATDNAINSAEMGAGVTLSGSNVAGATVSLSIGGTSRDATVTGTTWSYTLQAADYTAMGQGGETITATSSLTTGTGAAAVTTTATATRAIHIDTATPTLSIGSSAPALKSGETAMLTFTFSEAPDGFTAADIIAAGGSVSGLTRTADAKVYTATFTPTANTASATSSISVANASYSDAAGNNGSGASAPSISIDTLVPTVAISSNVAAVKVGETAAISITFSETPIGFTAADVVTTGGTLNGLTDTADPKVFTGTFIPTAGFEGSASITIAAATYTDAAGNAGGAGTTPAIAIDTLAPTLVIASNDNALKIGETATITFTFSSAPAGFAAGDVVTSGGSLSGLAVTADPKVYTATFTPAIDFEGNASITVAAGTYTDAAGNTGGAGASPAISVDTLAPTATATITGADDNVPASSTVNIAPDSTTNDNTPTLKGTITGSLGSGEVVAVYDGATRLGAASVNGSDWSLTTASLGNGAHSFTVRVEDAAGNQSAASGAYAFSIDASVPTATAPITGLADAVAMVTGNVASGGVSNDPAPVLSGTISGALAAGDVVRVYDGATLLGNASVSGATWTFSTTLLPGAHSFTTLVENAGGNQGVASNAYGVTLDFTPPVAPALSLTSDSGASNSDKITNNGALTATGVESGASVEYSSDGSTWSGAYTPVSGSNTVYARQIDTAGNVSPASNAFTFTFDNTAPAAPSLVLSSDTGSSNVDKITNNGALTASGVEAGATVEYSSDGSTWSGAFTPVSGSNTAYARQTDVAGNVSPTSAGFTFTFDNTAPAAPTLSLTSDSGSNNADKITNNGALTAGGVEAGATLEYSTNGGTTWSGTFTPAAGGNTVQARQIDVAGNPSPASDTFSFTFDNTGPSFTSPASAVFPNQGTGTAYTAAASDASAVGYGLSGTDAGLFNIDANSGAVTFKAAPSTAAPADNGGDNVYNFNVTATDLAGNASSQAVAISVVNAPSLSSTLDNVSNFEVTSNIVLTASENVTAVANKYIHIINDGGDGFRGESTINTQDILVTDTSKVSIVGNVITLNPQFDLDFNNNYHIMVDAGAFLGATSGQASVATTDAAALNFSTVNPSASATAAASQAMNSGTDALVAGREWWDAEGNGAPGGAAVARDFGTGNKAIVASDQGTIGIATNDFYIAVNNFGAGDMVYFDNRGDNTLQRQGLFDTGGMILDLGVSPTAVITAASGTATGLNGGQFDITLAGMANSTFSDVATLQTLLSVSYLPILYG